jgi:hypothetical protein
MDSISQLTDPSSLFITTIMTRLITPTDSGLLSLSLSQGLSLALR